MEKNKFENIEGIEHLKSRNKIEKKTIEIAIKEELKENRKVRITPEREHYDIISIGNNPKDIRYIEVKGHISKKKAGDIYLYESEFKSAKKFGGKYWIYLVNIIQENKEPIILKIRNPANRLKWKIVERWASRFKIHKERRYFSHINELLKNSIDKPNLKTIPLKNKNTSKDKIRKITILPIDKIRKIEIEDLKALNNIENISKEKENKLKELKLIRYIGGKITLTHSGIILLKLIRNKKLKEEELYELLKKEQGKIPSSLLKK